MPQAGGSGQGVIATLANQRIRRLTPGLVAWSRPPRPTVKSGGLSRVTRDVRRRRPHVGYPPPVGSALPLAVPHPCVVARTQSPPHMGLVRRSWVQQQPLIVLQQSVGANPSGAQSSIQATLSFSAQAGDFLIAVVQASGASGLTFTCTDNQGSVWKLALSVQNGGASPYPAVALFYLPSCKAASYTVTVTPSQSCTLALTLCEYSGMAGINPLDQDNSNAGSGSTSPNSGGITTNNGTELYLSAFSFGTTVPGTTNPETGWRMISNAVTGGTYETGAFESLGDQSNVGPGSYTGTVSTTNAVTYAGLIASFKAGVGAVPRPIPPLVVRPHPIRLFKAPMRFGQPRPLLLTVPRMPLVYRPDDRPRLSRKEWQRVITIARSAAPATPFGAGLPLSYLVCEQLRATVLVDEQLQASVLIED